MLFTAEIWIDEEGLCNECPCLGGDDDNSLRRCRLGEFLIREENRGKPGSANWVVPRPMGCPLKPSLNVANKNHS